MRADKALARLLPDVPGWRLRDALARKDVRRGSKRLQASDTVSPGDVLHVYLPEDAVLQLDIVWQDDAYLIINKRQGMPTQGEGSAEAACLRATGSPVFACHRLDVQTGGLLLLAKHADALAQAEAAFAEYTVSKTYQAIVRGIPDPAEAALHAYLVKDAQAAKVTIFDVPMRGALPIETRYRTITTGDDCALLEVDLITGRTHQIRAHLAHIGHPILGDDKYGDYAFNHAHHARKQRLWATRLTLWDGRTFEVPPGFDMTERKAT